MEGERAALLLGQLGAHELRRVGRCAAAGGQCQRQGSGSASLNFRGYGEWVRTIVPGLGWCLRVLGPQRQPVVVPDAMENDHAVTLPRTPAGLEPAGLEPPRASNPRGPRTPAGLEPAGLEPPPA